MSTKAKMSPRKLRQLAKQWIDVLEPDSLASAVDFLSYLKDQEAKAATEELLRIPGLLGRVKKAEQDIARGRMTDWRKVRRDV